MSRMTAMDVEKQEFGRKMRGFDPEEVRLYLRSVAEEIGRLNLDNGDLLEKVGRLEDQLGELQSREKTLQKTLVTAQSMSEEIKDKARGESELLVEQARLRSDQILKLAQDELARLDAEITRCRFERESAEQRLRGVLEQHLALLDMRKEARDASADNVRVLSRHIGSEAG